MHWAVAMPFMVCWATAVVLLLVYNPNPARPYRMAFSWAHRISGLALFTLPVWTIVRHWRDLGLHLRNIGEAWRWSFDDFKWIFLKGPAAVSKRILLPDQGKFNAGEKINFLILTATFPLYVTTGALIWTHQFAFPAWILHLSLAAMATPLMLGHIFLATINPDTRPGLPGMVSGLVDRHWASHHYARWYKENFDHNTVIADPIVDVSVPQVGFAEPLEPDAGLAALMAGADPSGDVDEIGSEPLPRFISMPWPRAEADTSWPGLAPTADRHASGT